MPETKTDIPDEDLRAIADATTYAVVYDLCGKRHAVMYGKWDSVMSLFTALRANGDNPRIYRRANTPTGWERVEQGE